MPYPMIPLEASGLNELVSLPPRVLAGLPLPTQLTLRLNRTGQRLTVHLGEDCATGAANFSQSKFSQSTFSQSTFSQSTFSQDELEAIALGVEHGRTSTSDVAFWIESKASDASFIVTSAIALDGVPAPLRSQWSLGEVLRELDASVVEAHVATGEVHELPQAA